MLENKTNREMQAFNIQPSNYDSEQIKDFYKQEEYKTKV